MGDRVGVYLSLDVGAALRASHDLLDDPVPFAAGRLDDRPVVRHRFLAALHVKSFELGVAKLALVERSLHPRPIVLRVLICAGDWVNAHHLPRFGETLVFLGGPFDARLGFVGGRLLLLLFVLPLLRGDGVFFLLLVLAVFFLLPGELIPGEVSPGKVVLFFSPGV